MSQAPQIKIPATYMRGGTSKGVFFSLKDLPENAQTPGQVRDDLLLRVIGSPDSYGKHTDGMGSATSSTSKVVIVSESQKDTHDVDYLFGQVAIDKNLVDWSGNCGNLSAAVGAFAIHQGLVKESGTGRKTGNRLPKDGVAVVRIWQVNIQKTIIAHIPMANGEVQECGDFMLDGVSFPAAEIKVEFLDPVESDSDNAGKLFPTNNLIDELDIPALGIVKATLINAGVATIFINAKELGYQGTELQADINNDEAALARFESLRAYGALKMGLISNLEEAVGRQHTPKIAFVCAPISYRASNGKQVEVDDIDLSVRALSMGKLHHAMMGTAAVAIAAAASIPGTLVNLAAGGGEKTSLCFGHPSGTLQVGAVVMNDTTATKEQGAWLVNKVNMSRSARIIMDGRVHIPSV